MKRNVGKPDMVIRIVIGLVIAALGFAYQSWWGLLATIPLVTALVRFCGLYAIFGISSCPTKQ